jgi:hypothetical protein
MTKLLDPNAPVTRLTSCAVVPEDIERLPGNFNGFPVLTQEEIDEIPEENLIGGIIVYNVTYQVYMCFMENRWNNMNTSLTYKGGGYEIGSPFALPAGLAADVESNEFNEDPGVMYIDTTGPEVVRIFINDAWTDLAVGGSSSTFENVTITENLIVEGDATITNLHITENLIVDGDGTFENITVNNTTNTTIANISTGNITTAIIGAAAIDNLSVTEDLAVAGIGTIANIRAGINNVGVHTPGSIAGLSGVAEAANVGFIFGTAAGTGASATIVGSPITGVFTLTTGTGCSGTDVAEFTLGSSLWEQFSATFGVIWMWNDAITYTDGFAAKISAKISALGTGPLAPAKWKVVSNGATQLVDSTQYQWTYLVIGNVASGI